MFGKSESSHHYPYFHCPTSSRHRPLISHCFFAKQWAAAQPLDCPFSERVRYCPLVVPFKAFTLFDAENSLKFTRRGGVTKWCIGSEGLIDRHDPTKFVVLWCGLLTLIVSLLISWQQHCYCGQILEVRCSEFVKLILGFRLYCSATNPCNGCNILRVCCGHTLHNLLSHKELVIKLTLICVNSRIAFGTWTDRPERYHGPGRTKSKIRFVPRDVDYECFNQIT